MPGMAADLRTHEQLREARGILVARADSLRDVAGEALRLGGRERAWHPRDSSPGRPHGGSAAR